MSINVSEEADWYCDKGRVAHHAGEDVNVGDVSDYDMDAAYKWVNSQLARLEINTSDPVIHADLQTNDNIIMAQNWYACFILTMQKGNMNPTRIIPDGQITSQAIGQGDTSIGYKPNEPTDHYQELTRGGFSELAQREIRDFKNNMIDAYGQPKSSIMTTSNAFRAETTSARTSRVYMRNNRYGYGRYY